MLLIVAIVGTTVAPWQLFFQQSYVADKRVTPRFLRYARADLGFLAEQAKDRRAFREINGERIEWLSSSDHGAASPRDPEPVATAVCDGLEQFACYVRLYRPSFPCVL